MPQPFDFALTVERFHASGEDRMNHVADGRLSRVLAGHGVTVDEAPGGVRVTPAHPELEGPVRRLLGAHADVSGFERLAAEVDPVLAELTRGLRGLRPALVPDPFEMLITSITAQQISQAAALATRNRLVEAFGQPRGSVYSFPSSAALATADDAALVAVGLSRPKVRYVRAIATSDLDFDDLAGLDDHEVTVRLSELPGIGRWSAEWYLARHLGRPDVWPAGDLALRRALERFLTAGSPVDEKAARQLGERYRPHRSLACVYLLAAARFGAS